MSELKPCPRCGTKAYLSRDVVDGFYFGWSAGCPRYCHYDGIHGTTIDKRVAFMDADGSGKTFTRMTGFTSLSDGKNSTEYSRQYVDEASERSDVVGYAPAIDYEFDRYTNDPVHEKIAAITDDEILGTEAQFDIVVVDLFEQKTSETTCTARKRTWSVIPDTEGDGTDALIYKGSFKAAGEITKGTATTTDGWKTCTFTAGGE